MAWQRLQIESDALRSNPLGDPWLRPVFVWTPDGEGSFPVVYVLHSHMRSAQSWFNVTPFETSYPDDVDRLAPRAIVVLVDAWTAVGGSQWIDSEGVGRYGTYLRDEVVPFVEERFPANGMRALQGKSSGAYGALVNALRYPETFHAVAAHAPMALFEVTIAHDFPMVARALRDRGLTLADALAAIDAIGSHEDAVLVEVGALAYAFTNGELPFRLETAELLPDVWARWLEHDPIRIAQGSPVNSRGIWIDAGRRDEYYLDLGVTALRDVLPETSVRFELFDGGHRGVSSRYPASLSWLVERLSITL